jgi:hypothetical protein
MVDGQLADEVQVLLNTTDGKHEAVSMPVSQWRQHPSADVAILPWAPERGRFQYRVYPIASAATEAVVAAKKIGAGDDVFITGLLVNHPGRPRNLPVMRMGSIAAIPQDPVTMTLGRLASSPRLTDLVTLVEVRSIGGLSGCPVFVHLPIWRDMAKGDLIVGTGGEAGSGGEEWLLGVMHGFFSVMDDDPDGVHVEVRNTGIAIVTRVDRVLDLINAPALMAIRQALREAHERQAGPVPTSAPSPVPPEFGG